MAQGDWDMTDSQKAQFKAMGAALERSAAPASAAEPEAQAVSAPAAIRDAARQWVADLELRAVAQPDGPVRIRELVAVVEVLTRIVLFTQEINERNERRNLRLDALEARCAALEESYRKVETRGLRYCGTFDAAEAYRPGDSVTHSGSLWIALEATQGRMPGEGATAWQLAVKKGRDSRDAR